MLGEITALAMVVALSPFTVLPAIALVVHSDRPRATGLAFISGWLVAKAAITTLFVGVPRLMGGLQATPPHWTAWLRVAAGVAFILAALWYWRRPGAAAAEATWVDRLEHITPAAAAFVGVALTFLNPKLVFACAAAGFAIGSANLGAPATGAAIAYFTLLGGSTAVLPILKAKKALAGMVSGEVLKVLATDPGSVKDFAAFAKQTGHPLLDSSEANNEFLFYLKKR